MNPPVRLLFIGEPPRIGMAANRDSLFAAPRLYKFMMIAIIMNSLSSSRLSLSKRSENKTTALEAFSRLLFS